jgi:ubiquinone/menaquinone biosynthesis C-methylase UbiE
MDEHVSKAALDWDYSDLAEHYRLRAPYAQCALDDLLELVQARADTACVDIGAGSGRLSAMLVAAGLQVTAVEPNPQMRAIGQREVPHACWLAARGEDTGLPDRCCDLVTFGSSFNVMPAQAALATAARLLRPSGWLA